MAWIAALASAYASYSSAQSANAAHAGSGDVNMTTTQQGDPYQASRGYRNWIGDAAFDFLGGPRGTSGNYVDQTSGSPYTGFGPGTIPGSTAYSGGRYPVTSGYTNQTPEIPFDHAAWRDSNLGGSFNGPDDYVPIAGPNAEKIGAPGAGVPPGGGSPGVGGGTGGGRRSQGPSDGFNGQSTQTSALIQALMQRANQGNQLYQPAQDYIQNTLQGQDQDPYRAQTFNALSNLSDPNLERYINEMFGGGLPGSGTGGGPSSGGFVSVGSGGGPQDMVGASSALKDVIAGKYLNQGNPYLQTVIDKTTGDINKAYNESQIPGINSEYTGAGMFGSSLYTDALANSAGQHTTQLTQGIGALNYGDYNSRMQDVMTAMGLGTQYDIAAQDRQSQANSAAASAGTAYASQMSQNQIAKAQLLLNAIGQGDDLKKFGLSGMGGLSNDFGQEQQGALGQVGNISGLDIRDLSAAGDLSLGSDTQRNNYIDAMNRLRASLASTGVERGRLNFDQARFYDPLSRLGQFADILNASGAGNNTTQEVGYDRRNFSPSNVSPVGQAIAGGLAGYSAAGGSYGGSNTNSNVDSVYGYR